MNTITNYAEAGVEKAGQAIEATRNVANKQLDAVENKINDLHNNVTPLLQNAADRASSLAENGKELASRTNSKIKEQANLCVDATGRYVNEKPIKSLLMAAAVGGLLTAIVSSGSSRKSRSK